MSTTEQKTDIKSTEPRPIHEAIRLLGQEINLINRVNGWDVLVPSDWPEEEEIEKVRKLGTVIALIHSEASEALESLRHRDRANFEEEMADIFIRVLDCTYGLGIDIGEAVLAKLEKNRKRGFRHGGKAV